MRNKIPTVSTIIVTYNAKEWLYNNIVSLSQQTMPTEIIVVDNNSTDGTADYIKKSFPSVKLIQRVKNDGYAAAVNIGSQYAQGKYLFIDNPDMVVERNYLKKLVTFLETHHQYIAAQGIVYTYNKPYRILSAGRLLHWSGILLNNLKNTNRPRKILSGEAPLVRRDIFKKIGGYDNTYKLYFEDIDFGWRLHLSGYQIIYLPGARIYHWGGGSTNKLPNHIIYAYTTRNCLYTYIKNFGTFFLIRTLIIRLIISGISILIFLSRKQFKYISELFKAWYWILKNFRLIYKKRLFVQAHRKISDKELLQTVGCQLVFSYIIENFWSYISHPPVGHKINK